LPQPPQLDVSLVVSTQAAPQVVLLPQAEVQVPPSHTSLGAHVLPHAPQFLGSEPRLTHWPAQSS